MFGAPQLLAGSSAKAGYGSTPIGAFPSSCATLGQAGDKMPTDIRLGRARAGKGSRKITM